MNHLTRTLLICHLTILIFVNGCTSSGDASVAGDDSTETEDSVAIWDEHDWNHFDWN